ncbi:MAG TPA: hypothetical protein VFC78_11735 [Tepidisphaeraceae bacterium]|nr:hypothetical protein [Tepidisphaeraceae bacterium]
MAAVPKFTFRPWTVVVLIAIAWLCFVAVREFRYEMIADAALTDANRSALASLTFADAVCWLRLHEFFVVDIGGGPLGFRGVPPQQLTIVKGIKRLGTGAMMLGDRWIEVEYQFTSDGKFQRIVLDKWAAPSPRVISAERRRRGAIKK